MNCEERTALGPAIALSALAGYVDSLGFILLGGYFVSFMSGNSTQLGVDLVMHKKPLLPAMLIALFVGSVSAGSILGYFAAQRRPSLILGCITLLLLAAAGFHTAAFPRLSVAAMVLAMGLENTVLGETGNVKFGLTYVTGSLVKVGQRAAGALVGTNSGWAWVPFLLLWAGLVVGAIGGTASYLRWGLGSLWIAAAVSFLMTVGSFVRRYD
jgi:uncharacterized membrane protein YoaK (UPF0700 family)